MKKVIIFFIGLICIIMSGCDNEPMYKGYNRYKEIPDSPIIAKVKILDKEGNTKYLAIHEEGKPIETEPFEVDKIIEYEVNASASFISTIEDNKCKNIYVDTVIRNNKGENIMGGEPLTSILKSIAKICHHHIMDCKMLKDQDEYFAYVTLNVNFHTPLILYRYDKDKKEVVEIFKMSDIELLGISTDN